MPYVMVPVPEEHVEDVMQFILRALSQASIVPWDQESINQVFHEVDEVGKSLLAFTSRATIDARELSDAEAAKLMQLTPREVSGLMNELYTLARNGNRPNLMTSRIVEERLPNGRTQDKRILLMDLDVAELIREAERDDLRNVPDPLAGRAE